MATAVATQDQLHAGELVLSRANQLREDNAMLDGAFRSEDLPSVPQKKLIGGPGYWVMLMMALFVDFVSVFLNLLIVFTVFATLISYTWSGVVWLYCYFHEIKISGSKQKIYIATLIVEALPLVNTISSVAFAFWLMCRQENKERRAYNTQMLTNSPASKQNL